MSVLLDEETVVLEGLDDAPRCEVPSRTCETPAVARLTVLCECRKMRLGCDVHIAATVTWFETRRSVCKTCGATQPDYRVVPL